LEADSRLAMVLAPRHPERFGAVATLLERSGVAWVRRSDWPDAESHAGQEGAPKPLKPGQIILLDTIGELASVYSLASAAFVGGSLVPAGGHNPLEPAQFGVPIVMGPHYANFRAITEDLLAHQAVRIAATEELAGALIGLLEDSAAAQAMGERAREVFASQAGATGRCVEALMKLLLRPAPIIRDMSLVDPTIANSVRRLDEQGAEIEAILAFLRQNGKKQIESIVILRSVLGGSLAQAKKAIQDSATWRDCNEAMDAEIDKLQGELNGKDEPGHPKQV
jgi:hypothetical protein